MPRRPLDAIEAGLVELAVARHREVRAQADRELDLALAPLRVRHAVDRLDFAFEDDGIYLTLPDAPATDAPVEGLEL